MQTREILRWERHWSHVVSKSENESVVIESVHTKVRAVWYADSHEHTDIFSMIQT